jgi:S1-C subfamily serine protease
MFNIKQKLSWMISGAAILALSLVIFGTVAAPPAAIGGLSTVGAQSSVNLNAVETQLVGLYDLVNPAVVSIQVVERNRNGNVVGAGQGSGFVYDSQGHIVTNYHVVGEAANIRVVFSDGQELEAELVGGDSDSDLAVVRVDPAEANLQPLPVGDSNALRVGQMVVAIGNPFGLSGTMTTGIVSALGRSLPAQEMGNLNGGGFSNPSIIQTDAAINPGNSGGPLLNLSGEVVGINTAIRSSSDSNSGIGFAVPANRVRQVVPALVQNGRYDHPWLGIAGGTLNPIVGEAMGLSGTQQGAIVSSVADNGPAAAAGLRGNSEQVLINGQTVPVGGDVIVSINGVSINTFDDLVSYLSDETAAGQTVTFGVLRDGQLVEVRVTLGARP